MEMVSPDQCRQYQSECRRELLEALKSQQESQHEDLTELKGQVSELNHKFELLNSMMIEFATFQKLHRLQREKDNSENHQVLRTRQEDTLGGWFRQNWKMMFAVFFPLQILLLLMAASLGQHFHSIIDKFADKITIP